MSVRTYIISEFPCFKAGNGLLIKIKAPPAVCCLNCAMDWKPTSIAPFDRDLELAVID